VQIQNQNQEQWTTASGGTHHHRTNQQIISKYLLTLFADYGNVSKDGEFIMTIVLSLDHGRLSRSFVDVEALTMHPAGGGARGAFEQWTKYQEEGRGSEELVNVNPELVAVTEIAVIDGALHVFGRTR
jgi:hypothetical protein